MRRLLLLSALLSSACSTSISPVAPTPVVQPPALTLAPSADGPLLLTGQSNAVNLWPALAAEAHVTGWAQDGRPLSFWMPAQPGYVGLTAAMQALETRPRALVFWQGETNGDELTPPAAYRAMLVQVIGWIRSTLGFPVRVIIVELSPLPAYDAIRSVQADWVSKDSNARLVRTNDLPFPDGTHIYITDYTAVAHRIVQAAQ